MLPQTIQLISMRISVLGAGSWGSALVCAFSHVAKVKLWSRNAAQIANINLTRTNPGYLPDTVRFSGQVEFTADFNSALEADLLVIATPVSALRDIMQRIKANVQGNIPDTIWVCKGFEVGSGLLPHQIAQQEWPGVHNIGGLLGPSFAKELALGLPTAITLASTNKDFALKWSRQLKNIPGFRIYANTDLVGSEVGAGVKNIMAIGVGICDGLQLGLNARAAVITRSLSELGQLVLLLGGKAETIYGLTGIGDLILTCTGDLSRNRTVGLELARGKKIAEIVAGLGHVAEGVAATREVYLMSKKFGIEMPIVTAVYKIIYEDADLRAQVIALLSREPKLEFEPAFPDRGA